LRAAVISILEAWPMDGREPRGWGFQLQADCAAERGATPRQREEFYLAADLHIGRLNQTSFASSGRGP
jgi:hypothetical protein